MKNTFIIWLLLSIMLLGQDIHYPFPHDHSSPGSYTFNCREYAMARAYGGNYCSKMTIGGATEAIKGHHWNTFLWNKDSVAVGDIVLWGQQGEPHVAYVVAKYGNKLKKIYVDQVPGPGHAVETNKTLLWVIQNTAAVKNKS
ncbi:MAG: hypothetical protein HOB40_06825 [Candidatus Marinimicrobia bacterium]|jgi:hypothetical protein|nr:hypothetical protein [Candidatus Neomarinimicrobiota bacterium]MBT3839656.1 hypothetical protein [Candidatus Neomarinimicrobiota bacterium]MBT4282204.1 hypothetical protein [Candidatus Neomarinimicrobiota bacterium]MBT4580129.1 hypothetical protein [Candidatus Neomarinimicrobiota bacterium]MBT5461678.1 hypothetical protein [Candidatus Neomarinimicrobiota bacterium]